MSTDNDETTKDLYSVKKRVSVVWKYFEKLNRFRVRCKICGHEQNYQGTTGNILRHLKNKHNINATVKGKVEGCGYFNFKSSSSNRKPESITYQENEHVDVIVKTEHNDFIMRTSTPQQIEKKSRVVAPFNAKTDLNPYAEENALGFSDYIEPHSLETNRNLSRPLLLSDVDNQNDNVSSLQDDNINSDILEKRLIAQIEYFREKAAFYRMQKNLTSLQAKKVRYELDQMD